MSKILYHGTSADNLKSILKDGFKTNCDKIWTPSENGIYFWSPDKLIEYKPIMMLLKEHLIRQLVAWVKVKIAALLYLKSKYLKKNIIVCAKILLAQIWKAQL